MSWRDSDQRSVTEMRRRRMVLLQKRLDQYRTDPRRTQREQLRECPVCFYDVAVAGQGFTAYTCQRCGKNGMHHNTNVPLLCPPCADATQACVQCGGDRQVSI